MKTRVFAAIFSFTSGISFSSIDAYPKSFPLPDEILLEIFSFLDDPKDLLTCAFVSRKWRQIANDPFLWLQFFDRSPLHKYCLKEFSPIRYVSKHLAKKTYLELFAPITSENLKKKSLKKLGETFCGLEKTIACFSATHNELAIVKNQRSLFWASFLSQDRTYTYQDSGNIERILLGNEGVCYFLSDKIALTRLDQIEKKTQHFYSKKTISHMDLYENRLYLSCDNVLQKVPFGSSEPFTWLKVPETIEIDAFSISNRSLFTLLSTASECDHPQYWCRKFSGARILNKYNHLICRWDAECLERLNGLPHDQSQVFSTEGSLLASSSVNSRIVWDLRTNGEIMRILKTPKKNATVKQLELHGDLLYEVASHTLFIWDLAYPKKALAEIPNVSQFVHLGDVLLTAEENSLYIRHIGSEDATYPWMESYFFTQYLMTVFR